MRNTMIFQQLFESQSSTYTYLLADANTKEAILIDSVLEMVDRDLKLIEELGLALKYVLDTHVHADHVTGAGEIRNRTGAKTAVAVKANVPCGDLKLKEGDQIQFGEFTVRAIETPGHTDSSLSFYTEGMIFTGDALLIRGCGRTDFQGGSSEKLFESVTGKLFKLPPETLVYPAHDYKGFTSSTIEAEMFHNLRFGKSKTKAQFVNIMANLNLAYPKMIDIALPANQTCGLVESAEKTNQHSIPSITPEELAAREKQTALLVDVRGADEYHGELGHIPGSHLITLGDRLKNFLEGYERSEEIIFICRSGQRSAEATKLGIQLGFKNVVNLAGGMKRWNECSLPIQK